MPVSTRSAAPTAAQRQALLHADAVTGRFSVAPWLLRRELCDKGYARCVDKQLVLTEYGWRVRARLQQRHQEFLVEGLPWAKVEEITDLYLLTGLSVADISRRARVPADAVEAVLKFRGVLAGS